MQNKKKGWITYLFITGAVFITAIILLWAAKWGSIALTDYANAYYLPYYQNETKGFSSPWYRNGLHIVDEGFVDSLMAMKNEDKNVVVLGSSLSAIPLQTEQAELQDGYQYQLLVCGNGTYRSDRVLMNLAYAADALSQNDIVKYEMSYSTFRDTSTSITESTIAKWGKYEVEEDLTVKRNTSLLEPVYQINLTLLRIQNVWELFQSYLSQKGKSSEVGEPVALGNFKNNYFNYEFVASTCEMNDEMKQEVQAEISDFNKNFKTVVEISPIPLGLAETEYGQQYMKYVDEELIPYLETIEVPYFDYRSDYKDEEFADGVHLSYQAGKRYTKKLNHDINQLIGGQNGR